MMFLSIFSYQFVYMNQENKKLHTMSKTNLSNFYTLVIFMRILFNCKYKIFKYKIFNIVNI